MLTVPMLKAMPRNTVFATGVMIDNAEGLFMTGSNRDLRWAAVRGEVDDWCVYVHFAEHDVSFVRDVGDKVCNERHIKRCVSCDDAAFKRYRY